LSDRGDTDILPTRTRRWARVGDAWLEASIECSATGGDLFDLAVAMRAADGPLVTPALQERYVGVSLQPSHPRYAPAVMADSEIAYVSGLLAAGDSAQAPSAAPAAVARTRRRFRLPSVARQPHRLAAVFVLLGLLFPGVAFVAAAQADNGTVTSPTVPTTPTTPTTESTPTDTTATTSTDTTPTATTSIPTVTDTTSSATTPTDTTGDTTDVLRPRNHPPEVLRPTPDTTPPTTTITARVAKPVKAKAAPKAKPQAPAKTPAPAASTLTIPGAFDPTPPGLRLTPAFAADLTVVATNAHVGWAQLLGLIRAQGHYSANPATEPALEALALRMGGAASTAYPRAIALSLLGNTNLADRAVALSNYYAAVGLPALVHGLKWAKPGLQRKLLADPRALIYPGGQNDIRNGRIDVRVLATIEYLAQTYGQVTVSCLITGHSLYARPGVISAHSYGLAVDIAAVKNVPIAGHQQQGGITESAIESILRLPLDMQPNQVISLLNLGGPSFALANHWDHIHIGFAPAPFVIAGGDAKDSLTTLDGAGSLLQLWQSAGATYGVPWQVLAAINKIESNFGKNMGPSSAGAIGWMQFLPSTWRKWGVDANGDGIANPWEPADAIYSAARYLGAAGAQKNLPRAVYSYNHAQWYVDEVLQLASLYGDQGAGTFAGLYAPLTFSDDASTLQQRNLELRQDPPMSLSTQSRLERQRAGEPDLIGRWLSVFTGLVGNAQQALPAPVVDWLREGGSLLEAMAARPASSTSAYDMRFRQTMDPAILSQLKTG
jgi:Transglycosylase SLT domain